MYYLYIPGLGDGYDRWRKLGLRRWRKHDKSVTAVLVPMRWSNRTETYEQKFARVERAIARVPADEAITLIGESAGGSMAIAVYHAKPDRVTRCVTLCGKNQGAERIAPTYRQKAPAFPISVERADAIIPKLTRDELSRICIVYSDHDHVIREADTVIAGARTNVLHIRGHGRTIWCTILRPAGKIW